MSVPEHKRKTSKLYTYDVALSLVSTLFSNFMNNFLNEIVGYDVKAHDSEPKTTVRENTEYLVNVLRQRLVANCLLLLDTLAMANSLYPVKLWEVEEKRKYQDKCIGICCAIETSLNLLVTLFPDALHFLEHYTAEIHGLIKIIQSWRKSNAITIKAIKKKNSKSPSSDDLKRMRNEERGRGKGT